MLDPSPEDDGTSPAVSTPRFVGRDRAMAALRGALVSVCPPLRESLTLGPIVDAFHRIDHPVPRLQLAELGGALRPLFPEWSSNLPPALPPLDDAKGSPSSTPVAT